MKLSIIVPCYNEAENIPRLHDELLPVVEKMVGQRWGNTPEVIGSAEIIFIDDGSRDDTLSRLREYFGIETKSELSFKFLRHKTNLGLGAAIRTGFSNASGDVLITVDSDGTYRFAEIPALLSCLISGVAIVTASPYHPLGGVVGVPTSRLVLSKGSSFLYRILVDWHVHTYTCLFRAYRLEVIKDITFESDGFLAGTEILVKTILKGYRVAELPSVLHRRVYGVSKARIMQTIVSHLRFQWWIVIQRLQAISGKHYP
jgi:dolichol-phosphate mannosyltransferase